MIGCLPVEEVVLPEPARPAVDHLRDLIGWLQIVWYTAARQLSGYAGEARDFLRCLDAAGLEPALPGSGTGGPTLPYESERLLRRCEARRADPASAFGVFHWIVNPSNPPRTVRAVRTMFETDSLPASWLGVLPRYHRIWVPSAFNLESFERAGLDPARLRVLPGTADLDRYQPAAEPWQLTGRREFAFLSAFDFQDRKGWDVLLPAYCREFEGDESVSLVLRCSTFHQTLEGVRARVEHALAASGVPRARRPHVLLVDDDIPEEHMPGLYTACDAYVCPTRGEGWNRPAFEALACGLPVIASRWSAHLDFLDDTCATLVDGAVLPVPDDVDIPIFRGQRWFEPDPDALRAGLGAVRDAHAEARARALAARGSLEQRFGQAAIAERIAELVLEAL